MRLRKKQIRRPSADMNRKEPFLFQKVLVSEQCGADMPALMVRADQRHAQRRGKRFRLLKPREKDRHVTVFLRSRRRADGDPRDRVPVNFGQHFTEQR